MSMPPSGVVGLMDEQAVIDAEIQLELENIDLDEDVAVDEAADEDLSLDNVGDELEVELPDELDDYIKRLQDQSSRFEQELLECDELLLYSARSTKESSSTALMPYDDHSLLMQLAKEHGCDVEEYRRKILEEIERDDVIIDDTELADLIDNSETGWNSGEMLSITENGETGFTRAGAGDGGMSVKIGMAVVDGMDPDDTPVSRDLVPLNGQHPGQHKELQKLLREQLEQLENRYQEKMERIKKDEAFKRDEDDLRQRRTNEERQWKIEEIHRQEQQLVVEREMTERKMEQERKEAEKEMEESMKTFQKEMAKLQAETERQKKELTVAMEMERKRQQDKQKKAVVTIQSTYRGYRVRKDTIPVLEERKESRMKEREEQRIREVEIEIQMRNEEKLRHEELERQKLEEEKRQKEETKRQKEEEKRRLDEEKRQKKEEEERIKQEEKKRKEEEKQRKKEEEKRKKEEEKRRKEEEEQRKREEKRLKEEEEKRKKEEEKRLKEEEKMRKEEEKRLKEEKKREKEKQLEEERKKKEEEIRMKEEKLKEEQEKEQEAEEEKEKIAKKQGKENEAKDKFSSHSQKDITSNTPEVSKISVNSGNQVSGADNSGEKPIHTQSEMMPERRPKTPRNSRSSRTPRPSTPKTENTVRKKKDDVVKEKKDEDNLDCLPAHLEALRLKFMKECLPWSKIGNEPWKLKAGVFKKPLRRPSSAKKLPLLSENVIIQAARVASLKMVTTVELKDLPGSNMSTLGQCGGLKYLTLTNCNLVTVEGLSQCKQLQYINIQNNKIEYVDLKDIGQLQYLNLSHNNLSSIHGIDNCTNLRWLDLSHNNITRLGGTESLRRLHTLKLSQNQLISTQGLGATPTLQIVDVSHNHLQSVEDIEKLCLLLSLNASSNNLLNIPSLDNQVLLVELLLSDNSLSSLSVLASVWLPVLGNIQLKQNSISELPSLQNCLLLTELNLSDNQISVLESVSKCVESCYYLEQLIVADNPVVTDLTDSFINKLKCSCPRLNVKASVEDSLAPISTPVKPRTSFEAMSLTQLRCLREIMNQFQHSVKTAENGSHILDQSQLCDIYYKFCDKLFNITVEYRYTHEYGEVSITMPSAPTVPKSGRPLSARQREKFMNPKEMFENALKNMQSDSKTDNVNHNSSSVTSHPKDLFNSAVGLQQNRPAETVPVLQSYSSPKDLFENALKTANPPRQSLQADTASSNSDPKMNGLVPGSDSKVISEDKRTKAAITIQAYYRGWHVRHEIAEHTKFWLAATTIQAAWRGYWCRQQLSGRHQGQVIAPGSQANLIQFDPAQLEHLNRSAVIIQACWKGYILRKRLMAALEYAQCDFGDDDDEDAMNLGDEFDFDKFMDIDQDLIDSDWKPPATPELPNHYPVLKKPPSGKPRVPPLNSADLRPPSNPRRAWRNLESPLSDTGKIPRPPSSVASTELTIRSGVSRKEEKMAEEWGFKDSSTAHLMMQRAKKMKYNAERRKKISKLDPKQRLALFRKLEEVTHPVSHTIPQRKTLPRKEYFQARQNEITRQEHEKKQEFKTRVSRTFEWLHSQVGDHIVTDSVINQGTTEGPKYVHTGENLPELLNGSRRVQLVSSRMSVELQSVESASTLGQKPRRYSVGSGPAISKLPPIQLSSAPAPHLKERMSFRNPKVNQSVGWGGGKKRSGAK